MAIERKTELMLDHKFDPVSSRHFLNGFCTVLHCHHYATLYTQLADDAEDFDGKAMLFKASEEAFYEVLDDYFEEHDLEETDEMVAVAEQYWAAVGMGLIKFTVIGPYAAMAEMEYSHIDEGWLKKWGGRDRPVNFITCGYVAAVTAIVNGRQPGSYGVREIQSLVMGDEKSVFKAALL